MSHTGQGRLLRRAHTARQPELSDSECAGSQGHKAAWHLGGVPQCRHARARGHGAHVAWRHFNHGRACNTCKRTPSVPPCRCNAQAGVLRKQIWPICPFRRLSATGACSEPVAVRTDLGWELAAGTAETAGTGRENCGNCRVWPRDRGPGDLGTYHGHVGCYPLSTITTVGKGRRGTANY